MMTLTVPVMLVVLVLAAHWLADFFCQTDWMALNKSTRWDALALHVLVYTVVMGLCGPVWVSGGVTWLLVNAALHFVTDAITSRMTSWLYQQNRRHEFFVVIGLDQFIHATCLVLTLAWWLSGRF